MFIFRLISGRYIMKKKSSLIISTLILIIFVSCSSDNTAQVTIKTGIEPASQAIHMSIPDRILSIFSSALFASAPPSNIGNISLSITGPGMEDTFRTFGPVSEITIDVPSGENRTFTLSAGTPTVTIRGVTTVDLKSGESKTISINMQVHESKIVIPDRNGFLLIQINDNTGAGWAELDFNALTSIGFSNQTQFVPFDTAIDNRGRIYIANNNASTGFALIIRIQDFISPSPETFADLGGSAPISVAFDKNHNYLYYCTTTTLYRQKTDGTGTQETVNVDPQTDYSYRGITVDNNGIVYIGDTTNNNVYKVNPELSSANTTTLITGINTPLDVMFKSPYLYVANQSAASPINTKIIQFTASGIISGELKNKPDTTDSITGPALFLAVLNRRFYIINDDSGDPERIISFDDISGAGWDSFDPASIAESPFVFYGC